MYTPKFNQLADRALLLEVMQTHSFAVLFGNSTDGTPTATHLPLVIKDEGPHGTIEGHFAKANPHWQSLAGHETLVVFSGPHAYVSTTNYAEELSVPTWNYIAVHAYGILELVEDDNAKDALLKSLIAQHEPAYADQWHVLPEGFKRTMLAGIVGFHIPIARIEGKFKLSQNRPEGDRKSVRASQSSGSADEQALAGWMQRLGI
ncbi:MAG: FMN-binding negative transcriptional regulator [Acidobacteriota bacterium]|nr:FMN-binding negative transcriptional regulator [Acidobacteriota bacterium]